MENSTDLQEELMIDMYKTKRSFFILASVLLLFLSAACTKSDIPAAYSVPEDVFIPETCVAEVFGNADAVVTIISDDGFFESGMYLNELMKHYDIRASVAGVVDFIDPHLNEWKDVVNEDHIEVINHSYSHKTMKEGSLISYDYFSLRHQIVDSDRYYEKNFGKEQIVFIWPENAMCSNGYSILLKNGFWASRSDYRGFNSLSPVDGCEGGQWYRLNLFGIKDDGVDTSVRNGWIDQAVANNAWVIEMWHRVALEEDEYFQTITIEEASEHLDYLSEKVSSGEVWNPVFTDAVKYIREKQNSKVYAYIADGELHLYVELTDGRMSYDTFNYPLTVGVDLRADDEITYYNVIPGEELVVKVDGQ